MTAHKHLGTWRWCLVLVKWFNVWHVGHFSSSSSFVTFSVLRLWSCIITRFFVQRLHRYTPHTHNTGISLAPKEAARGRGGAWGGWGSCLQRDFISISGAYINSPRTRDPGNNALQRLWEPRYELRLCQLHPQKHKDASWTSMSAALGAKRSPRTERSWCVNVKRSINPSVSPVVSHQNDGSCSPAQIQSFIGHKLLVAEFGSLSRASSDLIPSAGA